MNKKLKIGLVILSIILIIVLIVVLTRGKDYFHSIIEDNVVFLVDDVTKHYNYKMLPESKTGTKYTLSLNNETFAIKLGSSGITLCLKSRPTSTSASHKSVPTFT